MEHWAGRWNKQKNAPGATNTEGVQIRLPRGQYRPNNCILPPPGRLVKVYLWRCILWENEPTRQPGC